MATAARPPAPAAACPSPPSPTPTPEQKGDLGHDDQGRDRVLQVLARQAAAGLRAAGARLVCIDLDATFLGIHTGGAWTKSAQELRPHVRGLFLALVPLLARAPGVRVALVTFSPQEELVRELLALCFPHDVAAAVIVRADAPSWAVSSADAARFMPLWPAGGCHLDRRFKLPFLVSAAQHASAGRAQHERIRNRHTVLIDDDAANVRVARDCGVLALLFDAEAAKRDPRAAERDFCADVVRAGSTGQPSEEQSTEQSPSPVRSPSVATRGASPTAAGVCSSSTDSTPVATATTASAAPKAVTPVAVQPEMTPPRPPTGRNSSARASSSIRKQWARASGGCAGSTPAAAKPTPDKSRRRAGRVLRDILNTTASSVAAGTDQQPSSAKTDLPAVVRLSATPSSKFLTSGKRSTASAPPTSSRASALGTSASRASRFHMCTPSPVLKLKYTVDMGRPRSKRASRLLRSCTRSIDGELRVLEPQPSSAEGSAVARDGPPSVLASPASSPLPSPAARAMQHLFEAVSPAPPAPQ